MKLHDMDEYQGVTEEMVRGWLRKCGWGKERFVWTHPAYPKTQIPDRGLISLTALKLQCQVYQMGLQELLRCINPRWRKGFPSTEALSEHDEWLIRVPWGAEFVAHISYGGSDDGFMIMFPPDSESGECGGLAQEVWDDCFYWPCDGNASRVRWPTNAKGVML